jgi:hypothetical protein
MLGRVMDAAKYLSLLGQLDPGCDSPTCMSGSTLRRPQDRGRLAEGLRRAGLAA